MTNNSKTKQQTAQRCDAFRDAVRRRGVTVVEVLFATGIAVAGLLGIASLLLIAGRHASASNQSVETQALADQWYNELLSRNYVNPEAWYFYNDTPGNAPARWLQFDRTVGVANGALPAGAPVYQFPAGKTSICLDPYFYSERSMAVALPSTGTYPLANNPLTGNSPADPREETVSKIVNGISNSWYRPAVFPHFQDRYNPLVDPDLSRTLAPPWPDQPRMRRVSLLSLTGGPLSERELEASFASVNQLSIFASEEDRTQPPIRLFNNAAGLPNKAAHAARYSWLATLSPNEGLDTATESFYTLSLVVMDQRDRFFAPDVRTSVGEVPDAETNPGGERNVWVEPLTGNFTGGSGGRVQLWGAEGTDDRVDVGDWIMLGKHVSIVPVSPGVLRPVSVFRWFRVIGADIDSSLVSGRPASLPASFGGPSDRLWTRQVVLDGPDWDFGYNVGGPVEALTTGTLVGGAIAVHERVVEIPHSGEF